MNGSEILEALQSDHVCASLSPVIICQDESVKYLNIDSKHKLLCINSSSTTDRQGKHWIGLSLIHLKHPTNKNKNNNFLVLLDSAGKNLSDTPILNIAMKKALK